MRHILHADQSIDLLPTLLSFGQHPIGDKACWSIRFKTWAIAASNVTCHEYDIFYGYFNFIS